MSKSNILAFLATVFFVYYKTNGSLGINQFIPPTKIDSNYLERKHRFEGLSLEEFLLRLSAASSG